MPNVKRSCGCKCNGCIENKANHCLQLPCTRKKNRRTKDEWDKAPRHPGGTLKKKRASRAGTPKKQAPPVVPNTPRVVYPLRMSTPSGKELNLYGNSEQERDSMIANLERHGYVRLPISTGLGVGTDPSTEDGGQSS